MTTHYEKIQALGNRMVSNLETMGVSASFNDGGLTLADKILQIQHFTNGLLLNADKSVDQSGNTVKLTALLMKNGETVSGATVLLFTDWINQTYSSNTTINQSIGNEWTIDVGDTASIWICANGSTIAGGAAILAINKGSLIVYKNGNQQVVRSHSSSVYSYKDGVVYYGNSSVDISSYGVDVTNLYKTSDVGGVVKVTYGVSLTTDDYGVATASYTCTGAGKKEFYAVYGSLVSKPYEVIDGVFKDIAITGQKSNYWAYQSYWNITPSPNGTTITEDNSGNPLLVASVENATSWNQRRAFTTPIAIELDVDNIENYPRFIIYYNSDANNEKPVFEQSGHYKFTIDSNGIYRSINGGTPTQISSASITGTVKIGFADTASTSQGSLRYKNFVVYPI